MKIGSITRLAGRARTMRRDHTLTGRKFRKVLNKPDVLDTHDLFVIRKIYPEAKPRSEDLNEEHTLFLQDNRGYGFYVIAEEFEEVN